MKELAEFIEIEIEKAEGLLRLLNPDSRQTSYQEGKLVTLKEVLKKLREA